MRYAIMLRTGELAEDMRTKRPATYAHRWSATRAMRRQPVWVWKWAQNVQVTIEEDHTGKETYVVHGRDPALDTQLGRDKPAGSHCYATAITRPPAADGQS